MTELDWMRDRIKHKYINLASREAIEADYQLNDSEEKMGGGRLERKNGMVILIRIQLGWVSG